MKQNFLKELMTALLLLCCTVASAQDFEVGGIYYNILSSEDKTVEVTSGSNKYSGAVTIPASATYNSTTYSVTRIGDGAFNYNSYYRLTSIEIPSSVTSIGYAVFEGCNSLTNIVIDEENTVYDSRGNCNAIIETATNTLIAGCKGTIIPSSVTSIGGQAFYGCDSLTSIEIPSSVTSIGWYAFYGCDGLTSIEIHEGVTSIGAGAFGSCPSLTSFEIPSSVTSIGENVFSSCSGLTSIEIPSSVTSIGNGAFSSCSGLTSIEIPSSVTSIGEYAFSLCTGLTSIEIHEGVTSIGSIDENAFYGCSGLTSIVVDEGNTIYDSRGNCNAIIETASNTLISGCKNTIIPEGVTSISGGAFWRCDGLTSIEIPSSVTSIGNGAFDRCNGLTSIEIPSSVTSIGWNAFYGCSGLTSIVSHIAAEDLFAPGDNAFRWIDKDACTLYVPAGAKSTYAATEQWKDFTNIVELKETVNIVDGVPYTATEVKENVEVVYSRTFGNTNWQAWYVPFAIDYEQLSDDFEVAKINDIHQYDTDRDGTMDKTELEVVKLYRGTLKANYPYLVRAKEAGEKSITVSDATLEAATSTAIDCSSVELKYYFVGTCAGVSGQEMLDGGYYALSSGALMQAADNSVALKPLRWYMRIESRGEAVSAGIIRIRVLGDETTDVREVETEPCGEAVYYDLSGRRVENPTRGIYIVNGKKVYIK